jgi:hypothetical protein
MKSLLAGTALVDALSLLGATTAQPDHAYVAGGVNACPSEHTLPG